ncbi:YopT-type cysteine protease domain-containing protein [Candidatus Tisiphia endosymbiont of Dioctria rufipes]|uniref:YopT-type cysteine protease domain-containing protein n=1 Tax=Candidatus Tisiphia endosymbiont of Dioctria rufipes TaxID=3066255 RepID=UPI003977819A
MSLNTFSDQHATALYLDTNKILHFFDPNSGEISYQSFDSFVDNFWKQLRVFTTANLNIEIFSLNPNEEDWGYYKDKQQFHFTSEQLSKIVFSDNDYFVNQFLKHNISTSNIEKLINDPALNDNVKNVLLKLKTEMQKNNDENIKFIIKGLLKEEIGMV